LRSTVIGREAKHEMTEKECQGGIFCSKIEVFGQEKASIGPMLYMRLKTDKIESMTKKGSSEILGGKMEILS